MLENMFAGNVGTNPTSLKPVASPHTKQPTTIPPSDVPPTNTNETVTTDNSQLVAQDKPAAPPSDNFSHTLDKKIVTQTSPNAQPNQLNNKKGEKRDQNSGTLSNVIHPAKSLIIQGIQTQPAVLDNAIGIKVDNLLEQQIKSPAPNKSVWLLPDSQTSQPSSLIIQAAKPTTNKPDQIVPETPTLKNKPIQPTTTTTKQGQIISESTLPGIANESPILNANSQKDSDTGKTPETNKTTITSKTITSQELASEMHTRGNKAAINSEPSVVTNKPLIPGNSNAQLPNTPFAAPGDQSSLTQQKVLISQGSPAPTAEQTIPNKADTNQKNLHGKIELFELPEKDRPQTENLSVKSITQKISQPQMQPSAPQIGNHNNLLSNHGSNPGMEQGEQVLVGNNVQPAIAEQSPSLAASEAFAKTAGNVNSDVSVGSQIQESIHSSFQSGNQQIVVRLNPPELGKVAIKFTEQGDDVTGLLQVDKSQTRDQIQQVLPEIIQNLQDSGIQIKRLEVTLTNQQEQYTSKDQSSTAGQDTFSEQQSLPDPESQRNNTIYSEPLTNIDNVFEYMEPQMQLTDSSINMLV
ncbi:MAG: flagellar hook-length control protein FliK [Planctomycetota bacterium]|jgi:flagellar hook-length control protein FliK